MKDNTTTNNNNSNNTNTNNNTANANNNNMRTNYNQLPGGVFLSVPSSPRAARMTPPNRRFHHKKNTLSSLSDDDGILDDLFQEGSTFHFDCDHSSVVPNRVVCPRTIVTESHRKPTRQPFPMAIDRTTTNSPHQY